MSAARALVSSTDVDRIERRRVEEAILHAEMVPGMERFAPGAAPTVDGPRRMAGERDPYVGIAAHRYGWIPPGHEVAIIELGTRRRRRRAATG